MGGLSLLVTCAGGKLWRWDYRVDGKPKTMMLGNYPEIGIARARELHAEARKLKCFGVDPMEQRKSDKAIARAADTDSFASVARQWWEHWKTNKSKRHADTTWDRLKANALPKLGARSIREIEAPELVDMVKEIEARGAGDIAKRALQTVGQVFRYAMTIASDPKPRPSRIKVREHRARMRAQGLRPIQLWVPDVNSLEFIAEARR